MTTILYRYENFDAPHSPYVLIDYFFKQRLYLNTIAELNDPFEYLFSLGPISHINIKDMENKKKLLYQEIINFKEKKL